MRLLFQSLPGLLLKSGLRSLARYGTPQETIRGRLEQVYLPSDTRLEWPGEGALFELDLNKCRVSKMWALFESPPRPLFMSGLGPLARYGTSVNHYNM